MSDLELAAAPRRRVGSRARRDVERPPITATSDIDAFFERMRTLAAPRRIDQAWARDFRLHKQVIPMLAWIGVTNSIGEPDHERWNDLRAPRTRATSLDGALRQSYDPIFRQIDLVSATRTDLEGAFISAYQMGDPARYVRAFVALCRHAHLDLTAFPKHAVDMGRTGRHEATPRDQSPKEPIGTTGALPLRARLPGLSISLSIEIPATMDGPAIRSRLALVRDAIAELTLEADQT